MNPLFEIERRVLGAIIARPERAKQALERVPPEEWSGPHLLIAEAVQALLDREQPVSLGTVLEQMHRAGTLIRVGGGGVLHTLDEARAADGEDEYLLQALEKESLRRRAVQIGTRLLQQLEHQDTEPEEALFAASEQIARVGHPQAVVETLSWPDGDLDPEPDWIIPGVLAADERVMLTGGEGLGKSMLIRQLLCSGAVGRHPWTFAEFTPVPVLHVDLENPRSVSDASYRHIRNGLRFAKAELPEGTLHRWEPRLFDVENSHDVAALLRVVRAVQPRVIAIGPLKNMSSQNLNDEDAAVRLTNVLNRVRAESSAALIVEAHAGYASRGEGGDWRPRGSSSILGWPEVGLGMKPVPDQSVRTAAFVAWRGARTQGRGWPKRVVAGSPWPWSQDPRYEEEAS